MDNAYFLEEKKSNITAFNQRKHFVKYISCSTFAGIGMPVFHLRSRCGSETDIKAELLLRS